MATINNDQTLGNGTDPQSGVNSQTQSISNGGDPNQSTVYKETDILAGADGPNGRAIPTIGTDSLFNPFYVFRYAGFSTQTSAENPATYDVSRHRFDYETAANRSNLLFKTQQEIIENPTANTILQWAYDNGSNKNGPLFPYPYQKNDFLWCKWYGKIPNNRLLTLRRYNIPVEDNLQVADKKLPLVPIAQAVTWWGDETGNSLESDILNIAYAFNWKSETEVKAKVEDVDGNEVDASKILEAMGVNNPTLRQILQASFFQNPNNPFQASGYDETLQNYVKESWTNGAYWNRVLGPINVIDSTKIRDRGFTFTHKIKLTFDYKLRSFDNINPKIAMLDLISNFLALTYNRADFWGGSIRYFQKTGYIAIGLNNQAMEEGDYLQGLKDLLNSMGPAITQGVTDLKGFTDELTNDLKTSANLGQTFKTLTDAFGNSTIGRDIIASRLAGLHQKPLVMRSFLDGRAVGEWHLTVGNPMNPIAVMGNLCLTGTTMSMSDELGTDGFPTGVKFAVELEHGRPRAKQDILSMFNLGGGDLTHTKLAPPASSYNSYGEYVDELLKNANNSSTDATSTANNTQGVAVDPQKAENLAKYFRASVGRAYGPGFASSGLLPAYFTELRTKD